MVIKLNTMKNLGNPEFSSEESEDDSGFEAKQIWIFVFLHGIESNLNKTFDFGGAFLVIVQWF